MASFQLNIRGCAGLGDAFYLVPIVRHFLSNDSREGDVAKMGIVSPHSDVFSPFGDSVIVRPNTSDFDRIDVNCNYTERKHFHHTTQFEDTKILARVPSELTMDYGFEVPPWAGKPGRPYIVVSGTYAGAGSVYARPPCSPVFLFEHLVGPLRGRFDVVVVGHKQDVALGGDMDLRGQTTVMDLISIVSGAVAVICQVGYLLPMAEALGRPCIAVLPAALKYSFKPFLRSITPAKVCCGPLSTAIYDDMDPRAAEAEIREFAQGLVTA